MTADDTDGVTEAELAWLVELGAFPEINASMALSDAGIDSLLLLEWVVEVEDQTGRQLTDELIRSLRSVSDLCHYRRVLTQDVVDDN